MNFESAQNCTETPLRYDVPETTVGDTNFQRSVTCAAGCSTSARLTFFAGLTTFEQVYRREPHLTSRGVPLPSFGRRFGSGRFLNIRLLHKIHR